MKRYLLFAGDQYYPSGGWNDFRGSFDSVEEADAEGNAKDGKYPRYDWHHVIDSETGEYV